MKKFIEIDLNVNKLVYLTPPHAPVLVSTISPFNNFNLGSFEQFMTCSNKPPRIMLSITQDSDTFQNIRDGSDFCIGIPTSIMVNEVYKCGDKLQRHCSEFEDTGLTPGNSFKIKSPHILECSVNLECTLFNTIEVGDHSIVIGDVLFANMDESIFREDKLYRRLNLNAPYYITSGFFFKIGEVVKANKKQNNFNTNKM